MAKVKTMPFTGGLSGRLAGVVFVEQPSATVMRPRVIPRNPNTPAQDLWRSAMRHAGQAFRMLDGAQYAAWQEYAFAQAEPGQRAVPVVQTFMRLGAKAWQTQVALGLEPLISMWPPENVFGGDSVDVSLSATASGVVFTAASANAEGIVTELLLQPLPNLFAATFATRYRSKAFVEFSAGQSVEIAARPGCYACAVRFVRVSTGEQTALLPLGTIRV
ncbi:MAG: hypothetical protein IT363_11900 [Methanoregulaceae archaeon]|nr:hypothetical protein [Methanoregulaceae archaeon]